MNPLNSWLDADEVRHLAESLMSPLRETSSSDRDVGFDDHFIGFDANSAIPARRMEPMPEVTLHQTSSRVQAHPPFPEVKTPFPDRIRKFADWMRQQFGSFGIFLLDPDGAVIFDENQLDRMHTIVRGLAHSSCNSETKPGRTHVKFGPETTLEIITMDRPSGRFVLGAVVSQPLPPEAVAAIGDGLKLVTSSPRDI